MQNITVDQKTKNNIVQQYWREYERKVAAQWPGFYGPLLRFEARFNDKVSRWQKEDAQLKLFGVFVGVPVLAVVGMFAGGLAVFFPAVLAIAGLGVLSLRNRGMVSGAIQQQIDNDIKNGTLVERYATDVLVPEIQGMDSALTQKKEHLATVFAAAQNARREQAIVPAAAPADANKLAR